MIKILQTLDPEGEQDPEDYGDRLLRDQDLLLCLVLAMDKDQKADISPESDIVIISKTEKR